MSDLDYITRPAFIPRGNPLPRELRDELRREVTVRGDRVISVESGAGRIAVARGCAGFPVSNGTRSLIERYLDAKRR
jgi:hypothetical protein